MGVICLSFSPSQVQTVCFTQPEVYAYTQPQVLSRLNVLRALKESMSQMPVQS